MVFIPKNREPIRDIDPFFVTETVMKFGNRLAQWASQHNLPFPKLDAQPEMLFPTEYKVVEEYGCGYFGCVYPTDDPEIVFKVTTDPGEAQFVYISQITNFDPDGIVKYHGITALPTKLRGLRAVVLWREEAHFPTPPWGENQSMRLASVYHAMSRGFLRMIDYFQEKARVWDRIEEMKVSLDEERELFDELFNKNRLFTFEDIVIDKINRIALQLEPNRARPKPIQAAWLLYCLERCTEALSNLSVTGGWDFSLIGEALYGSIQRNMVICDVHGGNVGSVHRLPDDKKVITDPGLTVFLDKRLQDEELPVL